MRVPLLFIALIALCPASDGAEERPRIDSFIGKQYLVEDRWAGRSFFLEKAGEEYQVVWWFHGSGRPVISEERCPVEVRSDTYLACRLSSGDCPEEFALEIASSGELVAYLNGIRICITRMGG